MIENKENTSCSVVIPIHNEEDNLLELYNRLSIVLKNVCENYEIIFVNDYSSDKSLEIINNLSLKDSKVKFIDFSRNFGHQVSITAGMDYSSGEAVVIMDGDLQDPPELIPKLIEEWKKGFDVVYAVRRKREGETIFKKITASLFYRLFSKLANINMPLDTGDFRLIDRKVLESLKSIREKHRFMRGLVSWVGYNQTGVFYDREKRGAGETKYPFFKMLKFSIDGITSFSLIHLKIATFLGFIISSISFLIGLYFLFIKLFTNKMVQGWITLAGSILFIGGIQLVILGIIGEYIGRIYEEVKDRPLYIVKETRGFERK